MTDHSTKRKLTIVFASLCMAVSIIGCTPFEGEKASDAQNSTLMKEAIAKERNRDYDEAINLYKEVIENYKGASLANLQLAILLHEYKKDYLGAIFHYRKYIEIADKPGAKELFIISNRIEKVEQLLSAKYVSEISATGSSETMQLLKNYNALDKNMSILKTKYDSLVSSNAVLVAEIKKKNREIENQKNWIKKIQSNPSESTPNSGRINIVSVNNGDSTTIQQTYEVRPGDNLNKIAEYVYGDKNMYQKIIDANPGKIYRGDGVKAGDVLIIP